MRCDVGGAQGSSCEGATDSLGYGTAHGKGDAVADYPVFTSHGERRIREEVGRESLDADGALESGLVFVANLAEPRAIDVPASAEGYGYGAAPPLA